MGDFIREYTAYISSRTDAPREWHIHGALVALATAAGSGIATPGWTRDLYPNIWAVEIGRSGLAKSANLDMVENLLHQAQLGRCIYPSQFSAEGLQKVIAEQPNGVFLLQEVSAFLGVLNRDYNAGLKEWLTEIYDVPTVAKRSLVSGAKEIRLPTVSMLGASTPEWFAQVFKANDLKGGFLARFVFSPATTPSTYVADPGPRDQGAEAGLADHLRQVSQIAGTADFTRVSRRFSEWDRTKREALASCPPEFAGIRSRAGALAKKIAILFKLSRDPTGTVIDAIDLDRAITYVEHSHGAAETFLERLPKDKEDEKVIALVDAVQRAGGQLDHSSALKNTRLGAVGIQHAYRTAFESGYLVRFKIGRAVIYSLPDLAPQQPARNGTNGQHAPPAHASESSHESSREFARFRVVGTGSGGPAP